MRKLPIVLAFILIPAAVGAEPLGRLFFTPQERAQLDQLRRGTSQAGKAADIDEVMLNGIVRRSGGKSTTWINNQAQHDNDNPQGILVLGKPADSSGAKLQMPSGQQVELKTGQTYDAVSGKRRDLVSDATPALPLHNEPKGKQEANSPLASQASSHSKKP